MRKDEAREAIAQVVLLIRQYLSNTEFAPEPFTEPVNPDVLRIDFPDRILNLKDAQGNKYFAVLAENQETIGSPRAAKSEKELSLIIEWMKGYKAGQEVLVKYGWQRTEL